MTNTYRLINKLNGTVMYTLKIRSSKVDVATDVRLNKIKQEQADYNSISTKHLEWRVHYE